MPVLFHIGLFKTGNMSIQSFLRDHPNLLAEHNARFPLGWLRLNTHLEPHLIFMRPDRMSSARIKGDEWRDPRWCADVAGQIASDLAGHPNELTILSAEHNSLLRFDDELEPLRHLIGDAHVVVYLRDKDEWLESMRDELEKYDGLGRVYDDPAAFNYVEADSWLVDYEARVEQWRRWFTHVTTVDYDLACSVDGNVIPSFLRLVGIDVDAHIVAKTREYRLNARGTLDEGRVPGVRWRGRRFGGVPHLSR